MVPKWPRNLPKDSIGIRLKPVEPANRTGISNFYFEDPVIGSFWFGIFFLGSQKATAKSKHISSYGTTKWTDSVLNQGFFQGCWFIGGRDCIFKLLSNNFKWMLNCTIFFFATLSFRWRKRFTQRKRSNLPYLLLTSMLGYKKNMASCLTNAVHPIK